MSRRKKPAWLKYLIRFIILCISLGLIVTGGLAIWFATLQTPDLSAFEARKVAQSTKIFDRTGEILLYDIHSDAKRTVVPFSEISQNIKDASIAIEDVNFYKHFGIQPTSIIRAVFVNIIGGELAQGGSTITQQVIKNSVLTQDKTLTRKLKEWVLAIKIERVLTKDQILATYLNESPYGGSIYGVEEASKTFFGKRAMDVTIAEAAYLAAIPQAPTYYSPYGKNKESLDRRQKLVLSKMKENGFITEEEYKAAANEKVAFLEKNTTGIRAPHFSLYVKDYLVQKYGEERVDQGGFKVITTLNYEMQEKAEKVITRFAPGLESQFDAKNIAMVAINPKNGDILSMVGSRNYFDKEIDGNFNVTTALRQPGSTFKPFVYATAFMKGYTPETAIFDTKTEFSTQCTVEGLPKSGVDPKACYTPEEYDGIYEGPMTMKQALAHSRNVPAVKTLYLTGVKESISTAEAMGITSLTTPSRYGLTLVLGGGEVSLLELTSAYGVFANDGIRNPYRSILKVEDANGVVLEEAQDNPNQSIPAQAARQITDILSDRSVRLSYLNPLIDVLGGKQVATKTGTTNDYRDVWIEGYTPNLAVGFWAGKNDNTPMNKKVAGLIIAPVWGAYMNEINSLYPIEYFKKPEPTPSDIKPVLRGVWKGGVSYKIDTVSKKLATEYTPPQFQEEVVINNVHSILHWVDKDNPRGEVPQNPSRDSQYEYWEYGVRNWFNNWKVTNPSFVETTGVVIPTERDDVHTPSSLPRITINSPAPGITVKSDAPISLSFGVSSFNPVTKYEFYINDISIPFTGTNPTSISFIPKDKGVTKGRSMIKIVVFDSVGNRAEATTDIIVQE